MQRKHLLSAAIGLSLAAAVSSFATAQPADATHFPVTEAEVRRVDPANGKITLKHGEIKNLDMPPMTMVFQVREAAMLANVKAGDKVRVALDKINGVFTVMSIEAVR